MDKIIVRKEFLFKIAYHNTFHLHTAQRITPSNGESFKSSKLDQEANKEAQQGISIISSQSILVVYTSLCLSRLPKEKSSPVFLPPIPLLPARIDALNFEDVTVTQGLS